MKKLFLALAILALPSVSLADPAAAELSYFGNMPDVSFTYSVDDNAPRRDIEFTRSGQRFSFKWLNDLQGKIDMYGFDGTRYYFLAFQHLAVSRAPFIEPSTSWFLENPLYNGFKYFGGYNGQDFSPQTLMSPKVIGEVAEVLAKVKTGAVPNDNFVKFECTYTEGYPLPTGLHCVATNGYATTWKIESFAKLAGKNGPFLLPEKIVYEVRDELGRVIEGSSGAIHVDASSIKILDAPLTEKQFQVPISAVDSAFDRDTGVVLKGPDFK